MNDRMDLILARIAAFDAESLDVIEPTAKECFTELIRLTQFSLLNEEKKNSDFKWIKPAIQFMSRPAGDRLEMKTAPKL